MAVTPDYLNWVLEQLAGTGQVAARPMFGAVGLYSGEVFFGLIAGDTLYLKVSDATRPDFEARGMGRFRPYEERPQVSMNYYEVPPEVLEDADECVRWARKAVAAGSAPRRPRPPAKPPRHRLSR